MNTTSSTFRKVYYPGLDGLRALAIAPVVTYHAFPNVTPSGYLGVDVFFVLSGYLITQLIIADLQTGRYSMGGFLERRARRLLPAALAMSLASILVGIIFLLPSELVRLLKESLSHALFISNIHFFHDAGYFSPSAELRPFLHTWSLSVEEQFYLIAAPILVLAWYRWRERGVGWTIGLITAGSFVSAVAWRYIDREASFYLLPFRAWELGLGASLAIFRPDPGSKCSTLAGLCGILVLVAAYFSAPTTTRSPSTSTLLAVLGAAAIIVAATTRNPVARILSVRPLVWIGLISYSLYLWHWPSISFLAIVKGEQRSISQILVALIFATFAAVASYCFLESPIRKKRVLATTCTLWIVCLLGTALIIGTALLVTQSAGLPGRWSQQALSLAAASNDQYARLEACAEISIPDLQATGFCRIGSQDQHSTGRVVVLGDSHGTALMPLLDRWSDLHGIRGWQATRPRCKPLASQPTSCAEFSRYTRNFLDTIDPTDVIIAGRWEQTVSEVWYHRELRSHLRQLSESGSRIWVIRQVPNPGFVVPENLARIAEYKWQPARLPVSHYVSTTRVNEAPLIREIAPYVTGFIDPVPLMCNETDCTLLTNGAPAYTDSNHLSPIGALGLLEILAPITATIATESPSD